LSIAAVGGALLPVLGTAGAVIATNPTGAVGDGDVGGLRSS